MKPKKQSKREIFKKLRKSRGLSQEEAADRLDVAPSTVGRWERGDTPLSKRDLLAMKWVCIHEIDAETRELLGD